MYDNNNVFAKILRREIPAGIIVETPHSLAFHDISKKAPTHVLVIPKGPYATLTDFTARASAEEKADLLDAINKVVIAEGLAENGYRTVVNTGEHGGQVVPHLHFHILGGEKIGAVEL
ncbi:MAG: histidine triad nucleotide-binding protein [Alphaproteobacteria bacterium]|nr:histidine triad nucleotide-binding protein [Alphaproteobacteria bacterium]